jgi:Domain of unknown function (DUF4124)
MGKDFSSWSGVVKQSPLVIISSLSLIFCSAPVTGQNIYRWTDLQGRIHFSNAPVHEAEAIESELPPTSKAAQSVEHASVTGGSEEKPDVPFTQTATDLSESDTQEENPKKDAPSNKKKAAPSDENADDDDADDEDDGSGASDGSDNPQDEDDEDEPEETEASIQLPNVFSFSLAGKIFIFS